MPHAETLNYFEYHIVSGSLPIPNNQLFAWQTAASEFGDDVNLLIHKPDEDGLVHPLPTTYECFNCQSPRALQLEKDTVLVQPLFTNNLSPNTLSAYFKRVTEIINQTVSQPVVDY